MTAGAAGVPRRPLTGKVQMKIVLIDPPVSHAQLYGDWDLSALETRCPPLGLLSLAAFVRAHGHEARILDLASQPRPLEDAVAFVAAEAPRVVGLSARTINIHGAARLAERLRAGGFEGPIMIGGRT